MIRLNRVFLRTSILSRWTANMSQGKVDYFDYQATTPIDYRVLDAMMPFLTYQYGNPHSKTHKFGWDSATAIETAREQVATLIGADPR